jgi:hypothetical protein
VQPVGVAADNAQYLTQEWKELRRKIFRPKLKRKKNLSFQHIKIRSLSLSLSLSLSCTSHSNPTYQNLSLIEAAQVDTASHLAAVIRATQTQIVLGLPFHSKNYLQPP